MALVHDATLTPSKQELVASWLPTRSWAPRETRISKIAEYRFDDPAGEVGVETILWRTHDGAVLQTPLTYRGAPQLGAEAHLIGTTSHSVLGERWVYDGCGDPVWAATLAAAILTGGSQAQMYFEKGGQRIDVPARMQVRGSGSAGAVVPAIVSVDSVTDEDAVTVVRAGGLVLSLARIVSTQMAGDSTLTGHVGDDPHPHHLASLRRSEGEGVAP